MSQPRIPTELHPDLERVGRIVAERTGARPVVASIAAPHLAEPARLRSALVLLAAQLGAYDYERTCHAAASAALIYAATGVHDQLVDQRERRRGTAGHETRWGGGAALMVGDYLLALAAAEMALAPDQRIIAYYSQSVMAICEGQMAPVMSAAPLETARDQYLYRVACSDAALLEAAARAGGVCGGLTQGQIDTLGRFGHALGMAARLEADAADYEGPGLALRSGVITLPLIYAAAGAPQLAASLDQPDAQRVAEAQTEVRRLDGVQRAREDARGFARHAAELLGSLPAGAARDALAELAAGAA